MLKLTKLSGTPTTFILWAQDVEENTALKIDRIVLGSASGSSYVSEMDLPRFEVTLHFAPPLSNGKEMASEIRTSTVARGQ